MSYNLPVNGQWIKQFPEPFASRLAEKVDYNNKLTDLIEKGRTAGLGLDFESQIELRILERKIVAQLRKTDAEIKSIISAYFDNAETMTHV